MSGPATKNSAQVYRKQPKETENDAELKSSKPQLGLHGAPGPTARGPAAKGRPRGAGSAGAWSQTRSCPTTTAGLRADKRKRSARSKTAQVGSQLLIQKGWVVLDH